MAADWSNESKQTLKELSIAFPEETKEKLFTGAYGEGIVVKVHGLRCAGVKIDVTPLAARDRLIQQCLQLSRLRHPNIVQFLGVRVAPTNIATLAMELLPVSLSGCLEKYVQIPPHTKNVILRDIALGLRCLHEQIPAIIHSRLSTDCILLTCALQAKIAFGTTVSASATFIPPEDPEKRDAKWDVFGFGNIIVHVILQKLAETLEDKVQPDPEKPSETISVSEVQRREKWLSEMDDKDPFQSLAKTCLEDDPTKRPSSAEITEQLKQILADAKPSPYSNMLEMYQAIGKLEFVKENVDGLTRTIQAKDEEIDAQKMQIEPLKQEIEAKDKVISTQQQELQTYMQSIHVKNERIKANEQANRAKDALIKAKGREIAAKTSEIVAKESFLRAANRRIEQLEQLHPSTKKAGSKEGGSQPASPRKLRESPVELSSFKTTDDMVRFRDRRSSDGSVYRNWRWQKSRSMDFGDSMNRNVDPKLASLLARQQQKIEESSVGQAIQELGHEEDNTPDTTDSKHPS